MGGSRLDRLVLLLDTGSTPSVRLTAARQLGALAATRVSHPSVASHGHTSVAPQVKLEDGTAAPSKEGIWRGVDGEWNEVVALVQRVLPYLQSRSIETRQAAASALGFISRGAGIWDPSSTAPSASTAADHSVAPSITADDALSTAVTLRDFDLARILRDGALLLGSSGKEYGKLGALSAEELAQAQKDALKNLGLGFGGGADDIGVDVGAELAAGAGSSAAPAADPAKPALPPPRFKPGGAGSLSTLSSSNTESPTPASPSPAPPAPAAQPQASTSASPAPAPAVTEEDEYAGLSARERNKLKRKRKAEGKAGVAPSAAPVPAAKKARTTAAPASATSTATPSPAPEVKPDPDADASGKVVVDPAAKAAERARLGGEIAAKEEAQRAEYEVRAGEWPWRACVERLAAGLLAPAWETRHGAALGLREVLRLQGDGGGRLEGLAVGENEERHRRWCEDLATKLLCVFALDRFGDYVSDQVIAPVRETAAQALATLLPSMPASSASEVQRILVDMVHQRGAVRSSNGDSSADASKPKYIWQVRHSGLLGLKYFVAVQGHLVRGEPVAVKPEPGLSGVKMEDEDVKPAVGAAAESQRMLKSIVDAALVGLRDRDDDVRSAGAATLVPLADALVEQLPGELKELVDVLWACLGDLKDDLASSVGGVMDLLAKLLGYPAVLDLLQSPAMETPLPDLIPRLFPFFRHTISSVRLAVLNTLLVFLELPSIDPSWVDSRVLRLLFQNLILEERPEIRRASEDAWLASLAHAKRVPNGLQQLVSHAGPCLAPWFSLLFLPIGTPIGTNLLWSPTQSLSGEGGVTYSVDKPMLRQDLALVSIESITRGRVSGAVALGTLLATWPADSHDATFGPHVEGALASAAAFQRFLAAIIVEEWASTTTGGAGGVKLEQPLTQSSTLAARLVPQLHALLAAEPPASYAELDLILSRLRADCTAFYTALGTQGKVPAAKLPSVPDVFGVQQAQMVANSFKALVSLMPATAKKALPALEERQRKVTAGIAYFEGVKAKHDRQVYAALGGAVIALQAVPAKITPLIRSVTNSIKTEENLDLQARSAGAIAALIDFCSSPTSTLRVNPSDKLVKNLCTFLCQDTSRTPIFSATKATSAGILTLVYNPARGTAEKASAKEAAQVESEDEAAAKLVFRGAQLALSQLAARFGPELLDRVPKLWSCMADALLEVFASANVEQADAILQADDQKGQDLIDALTVLPVAAANLTPSLHKRLESLLPALSLASRSKFAVIRYAVAKSFATLCDIVPTEGMRHVVESVVPVLADPLHPDFRRGAIELISHIVELLDVKILPYVIFLVVPVLGRMSDSDDEVRLVATNTFATLVKLVPLEAGLPDPPGFSDELLAKRASEREFLMQLLDGSKVAEYKIPVDIGVDLRKYQRDGVSWLAFLARYQLHGLLCDDMGLGKTLQSITILASMHHERAERYKATQSPDSVHLPSLIICPPTLTGHWKHEINTYAKDLCAVIYSGPRDNRDRLLNTVRKYDAVIMSYDVARNDVAVLAPIDWHYCILDEGHVIKNGKTKLTKAVKSLKAIHRLILSGTPIQNNVLELWSLFDFLMPGFLGSEKAFNDRFGKPIAASRDAKSSSKEQEAGALALEALHKQVLPFILRRLKEDVLDDLPPKIIQDYHVELSPLQKQMYDDFSTSQAKSLAEGEVASSAPPTGQKPQHVFQALQYLRKLVNHPALVYKPEVPQHQAALAKVAGASASVRDIAHAPKIRALQQILLDCGIGANAAADANTGPDDAVPQHRALIFCQLKGMLDVVENDLLRALMPSVTYMRLDGSTDVSKRHAICQTFNSDPSIDCLLLTTHVGGLGLNLTGADTVIFVEHDWNPMKDLQAMDRAHRLGQKKVVNVYRLIMRGTLEEKIMGLQRFKLNIASSIVSQQNSDLGSLGTDQILDLFQVSDTAAPAAAPAGDKPMSQKAILDSLDDIPNEDEYGDLDLASFMAAS
ncbi:DNA-binding ATPase [Rhodotorula paludigena]|uniref:DNA-binding ATPase n=1 Tax=Rhodotorula paludigena TaxID=86838 RepID=UPI00317302E8